MNRARNPLARALELVDEAIDVLREYVRGKPEKAEELEDILYALEEVSEELDRLASAEEQG